MSKLYFNFNFNDYILTENRAYYSCLANSGVGSSEPAFAAFAP